MTVLLDNPHGKIRVMASLLYGSGLRVNECVNLRMKDIDLAMKSITIRNAKGMKARVIPIPERLIAPMQSVMITGRNAISKIPYKVPAMLICPGHLIENHRSPLRVSNGSFCFARGLSMSTEKAVKKCVGIAQLQPCKKPSRRQLKRLK